MRSGAMALALLAGFANPSAAYAQAPTCPLAPVLPAALAGWGVEAKGKAAAGPREIVDPIALDRRTRLSLVAGRAQTYSVAPEKAPADATWGGMAAIDVARPGTLTVTLGTAAWIDLVRDGAVVSSSRHGHGPACSGIRKMVDFAVTPGRYLVQISGAPAAEIDLMAVLRD